MHKTTGSISRRPKIISNEKISNRGSEKEAYVVEGVSKIPTAGPIFDKQLMVPEIASMMFKSKKVVAAAEAAVTKI